MSASDPEARRVIGGPLNVLIGLVVFLVGLVVALSSGGWGWLMPLAGLALAVVSAVALHLDPPGGPRRRLRDLRHLAVRQSRRR